MRYYNIPPRIFAQNYSAGAHTNFKRKIKLDMLEIAA